MPTPRLCRIANSFPRARGHIREIMDSYTSGELTSEECAERLLEAALGVENRVDMRVRQNFSNRRQTKEKAAINNDERLKGFLNWLVETKNFRSDTATQYVQSLNRPAANVRQRVSAQNLLADYLNVVVQQP